MTTRDDGKKTKAQLLEEIEGLRRQLAEQDESPDAGGDAASSQPAFVRPITRRTALSQWVAPVILSIPLAAVTRTRTAEAGTTSFPTIVATSAPTVRPTMVPPTAPPTFPTFIPTMAPPTLAPTMATVFPTLAPAEAPALGSAALAAAAAALGGVGAARLRKRGQGESVADNEQSDPAADDSQDKDGTK